MHGIFPNQSTCVLWTLTTSLGVSCLGVEYQSHCYEGINLSITVVRALFELLGISQTLSCWALDSSRAAFCHCFCS